MIKIKNRIKLLRKELGMTQQKFADAIGVKQNTVAQYEIGRNDPNDTVINLICREYNVDEHWLRTGEGEMFKPKDRNSEIATIAADLYLAPDDDPKTQLIKIVHDMSQEEIEVFVQLARKFAQVYKKDLPDD